MKRLAVLISNAGTGTNLQAIIDSVENKKIDAKIAGVISDTKDALGLNHARKHDLTVEICPKKEGLLNLLKKYNIDYVCLTGWKQIIPDTVLQIYQNKILNVHPGLIPDQPSEIVKNPDGTPGLWNKGKFTDKSLKNFFEQKATYAGSSIHFLTQDVDNGPVLERCFEKILPGDTIDSLYTRLKKKENEIYVKALGKLCNEKYALISVYDKTGIVDFAKTLTKLGFLIISTGGTAAKLQENKIPVIPIQDITGNPESFDGRMKTISFQIESGIIYDRTNPKHVREAQELKIKPIDLVVCNLYPFQETPCIENIDVGGPTMIRAAAKNFKNVLVVTDSLDYQKIGKLMSEDKITYKLRQELASKAFYHLSYYDSQVAQYLNKEKFPKEITIAGLKVDFDLRYGENPHQAASLYFEPNTDTPLKKLAYHAGRKLSYINVTDIWTGLEVVRMFDTPAAAIIKHNSPCGIALGKTPVDALIKAIKADPISAFGGVVVLNKPIDEKITKVISSFKDEYRGNIDIFAAPGITERAIENLHQIRKSMGIYTFGKNLKTKRFMHLKGIDAGFLIQDWDDDIDATFNNWQIVTESKPTKKQIEQIKLAWKFVTRIRSNTVIVVDKSRPMTRGIGSGQTSRIESAKIALKLAGNYTKGGILASDGFFPFDDVVKLAAKYKIGAIVTQGGSINDKLVIKAADEVKIPMIFTQRRAFWH